jgi:excisionase family DNA binding protein
MKRFPILEELLTLVEKDDEDKDIDRAPPPGKTGEFVTTAQAARILGVTMSRIRQLVGDKELQSYTPEKGRRDHLLKRKDVQSLKGKIKDPGRPPKEEKDD